jgi:hypothetical protein
MFSACQPRHFELRRGQAHINECAVPEAGAPAHQGSWPELSFVFGSIARTTLVLMTAGGQIGSPKQLSLKCRDSFVDCAREKGALHRDRRFRKPFTDDGLAMVCCHSRAGAGGRRSFAA